MVDRHTGVVVARALGEPDFSARHKAVVQEAMAQVTPLVGGPLARFNEPSPGNLPPRTRDILRCLLEGDSDKEIVARLGLTRNTVNQYVKTIFAHFGVRSRAELLARWVRRGWGGRFAWSE
jgi:DNA-binding NarL/FixJ family response regulator